jgi:2-alkenal reductase
MIIAWKLPLCTSSPKMPFQGFSGDGNCARVPGPVFCGIPAVPVDVVNQVVPQLIARGKFPRPGIGIMVLDEEITARLGITGVVIDKVVPGSEAERAGLEGINYKAQVLGDVIVAVEGRRIANMADFVDSLKNAAIGDVLKLKVRRGDQLHELDVTVMDIS